MQTLSSEDYRLIQSLCRLGQESMRKTLIAYLRKRYKKVISTKEYIYAEGDIPIGLVAHMDTVFVKPPTSIYYDKEQGVMWSPEGLGADDRAGIFCILKILQAKLRPTIIFTTDEEVGCLGAEALVKAFKHDAPSKLNYIIQLDRRGSTDCVFYDCDNLDFVKYVESFGFIEAIGSLSDISVICPEWGMAGVNLSVGYENEHSESEILHVVPMLKTIDKVKIMLTQKEIPEFKYIPSEYSWNGYKNYQSYGFPLENVTCAGCGKTFSEYDVLPVIDEDGRKEYYCPDCCVDNLQWCDECNRGYKMNSVQEEGKSAEHICPSCKNKKLGVNK